MSFLDKITPLDELPNRLALLPRPMVFTNGVFDILHPGHVEYLAAAKALGESLVVGINTDSSARRLEKGADRPINPEADRAIMLAALASVTLVTFFKEDTPVTLLHTVRPDIYVKGGDYDMERLEETTFVRSYGGDSRALPFLSGYSTTRLLERIRASEA